MKEEEGKERDAVNGETHGEEMISGRPEEEMGLANGKTGIKVNRGAARKEDKKSKDQASKSRPAPFRRGRATGTPS